MSEINDVLGFWFERLAPEQWFEKDAALDDEIRAHFGALYRRAAAGGRDDWRETPEGTLALVIVLDQFPRNMFRESAKTYAADAKALDVARRAVERDFDLKLPEVRRRFLYLPFEHSESLEDQRTSVRLVRERGGNELAIDYAERHLKVIERFGRFPHRNEILGRESTEEEAEFLASGDGPF